MLALKANVEANFLVGRSLCEVFCSRTSACFIYVLGLYSEGILGFSKTELVLNVLVFCLIATHKALLKFYEFKISNKNLDLTVTVLLGPFSNHSELTKGLKCVSNHGSGQSEQ